VGGRGGWGGGGLAKVTDMFPSPPSSSCILMGLSENILLVLQSVIERGEVRTGPCAWCFLYFEEVPVNALRTAEKYGGEMK
jgi:hypothetical protein